MTLRVLDNERNLKNRNFITFGAKVVPNWEQNTLYTKSWQISCRKSMSMLTGL